MKPSGPYGTREQIKNADKQTKPNAKGGIGRTEKLPRREVTDHAAS